MMMRLATRESRCCLLSTGCLREVDEAAAAVLLLMSIDGTIALRVDSKLDETLCNLYRSKRVRV